MCVWRMSVGTCASGCAHWHSSLKLQKKKKTRLRLCPQRLAPSKALVGIATTRHLALTAYQSKGVLEEGVEWRGKEEKKTLTWILTTIKEEGADEDKEEEEEKKEKEALQPLRKNVLFSQPVCHRALICCMKDRDMQCTLRSCAHACGRVCVRVRAPCDPCVAPASELKGSGQWVNGMFIHTYTHWKDTNANRFSRQHHHCDTRPAPLGHSRAAGESCRGRG